MTPITGLSFERCMQDLPGAFQEGRVAGQAELIFVAFHQPFPGRGMGLMAIAAPSGLDRRMSRLAHHPGRDRFVTAAA